MTAQIHQKYALEWIQEAVGIGIILGIVGFVLVAIGGLGTVLVVIILQLLGAALLVFSLFSKVETMVRELTEVKIDTNNYQPDRGPEWKEWSHQLKGRQGDKKVFKISGKTRTANFVVDSDGIRVKSRLNKWLLDADWVKEATEYLETVTDADKE